MTFQTVGVVGAGVMGRGVAISLAQTRHQALLIDISEEILAGARQEILQNLRFLRMFSRDDKSQSANQILSMITLSTDSRLLEKADFIFENVTETWEIKRNLYAEIDAICPGHCVFASNTSVISITRLASVTKRPAQVIGAHFMNPAHLKTIVEVIRGYHTSDETLNRTQSLLNHMGKECIVINDSPGFVSNRVLMSTINEAIHMVQEQVASIEEIDKVFRDGFGHKMGPLETADLIGLDTILFSLNNLHESFGNSNYNPCSLLRKMVDAGLYGRKSGRGFYSY